MVGDWAALHDIGYNIYNSNAVNINIAILKFSMPVFDAKCCTDLYTRKFSCGAAALPVLIIRVQLWFNSKTSTVFCNPLSSDMQLEGGGGGKIDPWSGF